MAIENSGASQCAQSAQPARSSDSRTLLRDAPAGSVCSKLFCPGVSSDLDLEADFDDL